MKRYLDFVGLILASSCPIGEKDAKKLNQLESWELRISYESWPYIDSTSLVICSNSDTVLIQNFTVQRNDSSLKKVLSSLKIIRIKINERDSILTNAYETLTNHVFYSMNLLDAGCIQITLSSGNSRLTSEYHGINKICEQSALVNTLINLINSSLHVNWK